MNKSAFLQLIQQVSGITDQQTDELEKVASAFPYCQTAHLLLAKSAYDKGSMLSSQRLRRASSYATNRQLLKKLIYSVPAPVEPVIEEEQPEAPGAEALPTAVIVQEEEITTAEAVVAAAEIQHEAEETDNANEAAGEAAPAQEKAEEQAAPQAEAPEEDAPSGSDNTSEESLYSELAMLLTINSLSSSSTDLLVAKPDKTAVAPAHLIPELLEKAEAAPALDEDVEEEAPEEQQEETAPEQDIQDVTGLAEVAAAATIVTPAVPEISETEATPTDAVPATEAVSGENQAEQPYGEVNYSFDEIDRLYAEDALGYWMGSSRMGEVLQLKDEYTRQRPQSFHPELILEYSKTHELEKAIQPVNNVLSNQLDIIDHFLKLNPRLKTMASLKLKPEPQEDLSLKSTRIKKGMASENLASIFLKQGKVKKAIKIYEQLILKYPEKKVYFAEQIEKLQNIN